MLSEANLRNRPIRRLIHYRLKLLGHPNIQISDDAVIFLRKHLEREVNRVVGKTVKLMMGYEPRKKYRMTKSMVQTIVELADS